VEWSWNRRGGVFPNQESKQENKQTNSKAFSQSVFAKMPLKSIRKKSSSAPLVFGAELEKKIKQYLDQEIGKLCGASHSDGTLLTNAEKVFVIDNLRKIGVDAIHNTIANWTSGANTEEAKHLVDSKFTMTKEQSEAFKKRARISREEKGYTF